MIPNRYNVASFPPPVFDHLLYANWQWQWPGNRLDIMSEELVVEPHAVTKLPDAKPLRLIGCFSLMQKKYSSGNLLLVEILPFYAVNTC